VLRHLSENADSTGGASGRSRIDKRSGGLRSRPHKLGSPPRSVTPRPASALPARTEDRSHVAGHGSQDRSDGGPMRLSARVILAAGVEPGQSFGRCPIPPPEHTIRLAGRQKRAPAAMTCPAGSRSRIRPVLRPWWRAKPRSSSRAIWPPHAETGRGSVPTAMTTKTVAERHWHNH
jgi:hypothetical protein